jgi:hypothetical protein
MLYELGLRNTDLLRIDWQAINLSTGRVVVKIAKTDETASLELSHVVVAMLANLPGKNGRRFPWSNRSSVYKWLRHARKQANVHYTPHFSRHALAAAAGDAQIPDGEAAKLGVWREAAPFACCAICGPGHAVLLNIAHLNHQSGDNATRALTPPRRSGCCKRTGSAPRACPTSGQCSRTPRAGRSPSVRPKRALHRPKRRWRRRASASSDRRDWRGPLRAIARNTPAQSGRQRQPASGVHAHECAPGGSG